jgi:peroxiredoxin
MNIAKGIIAVLALAATGAFAALLAMPERSAPQASFVPLSGERFSTSSLRGKVAVVTFWATWCPACVREMPHIVAAHRKYAPQGYETVAVAVRDRAERVAAFARERALPFKVVVDDSGEISSRFGNIRITPTTFVIDREGRVLRRFTGKPDWGEFDRLVEKALAEPS